MLDKIYAIKALRALFANAKPELGICTDENGSKRTTISLTKPTLKECKDFVESCMALGVSEAKAAKQRAEDEIFGFADAIGEAIEAACYSTGDPRPTPLLAGILVVPTTEKHDGSGYPVMRIYGVTPRQHDDQPLRELIVPVSSGCDVLDLEELPMLKSDIVEGYQHIFCRRNYIYASGCSTVKLQLGPRRED